ncbi:MAG TPA: Rad52/Rad22 family DNA repair protein [Gemmataceae bacterium]|nr:Rad52/Rad22 family DNA repair protein [Gemmataceae bacterium]
MHPATNPNPERSLSREELEAITRALAAPFDPSEIRFKPGAVSGNRALALAYVDARVIQDRLDEVLGVMGWQDDYEWLDDGSVVCRLKVRIGNEWITKCDVGGPSEQPDEGDRRKAAFSDALKRAAVKFGVGRYLYRLPGQWVAYDPQRRQFVHPPRVPVAPAVESPARRPAPPTAGPLPASAKLPTSPPASAKQPAVPKTPPQQGLHTLPANGAELQRRLYDYDARLAAQGICQPGDLVKHVVQAGVKAGYDSDLETWTAPGIILAVEQTKAFEAEARQRLKGAKDHKEVA